MNPTSSTPAADAVQAVRSFNRFYTQRIGVLDHYLGGGLSLTEMRLLWELAQREQPTATELARALTLDPGFLSRLLRRFEARGWVSRQRAAGDARQSLVTLTRAGRKAYEPLARRSDDETAALLATLPPAERPQLLQTMARLHRLLLPQAQRTAPQVALRDPAPGDMGWVIEQHGAIYWREHGYGAPFEALAAEISARFLRQRDPQCERGWIAEVDGERVGCVFLLRRSATVAQLRMLLLTPAARGHGVGARLVDACIAFARECGYRRLMLWTMEHLTAARAIYERRGFRRTKVEPDDGFGTRVMAETWELRL